MLIVNLDKDLFIQPRRLAERAQTRELDRIGMLALTVLVTDAVEVYLDLPFPVDPLLGSWAADRVVLASGENEEALRFLTAEQLMAYLDLPEAVQHTRQRGLQFPTLCDYAEFCCRDLSDRLAAALLDQPGTRRWLDEQLGRRSTLPLDQTLAERAAISHRYEERSAS